MHMICFSINFEYFIAFILVWNYVKGYFLSALSLKYIKQFNLEYDVLHLSTQNYT